jgi:hypothetical protein
MMLETRNESLLTNATSALSETVGESMLNPVLQTTDTPIPPEMCAPVTPLKLTMTGTVPPKQLEGMSSSLKTFTKPASSCSVSPPTAARPMLGADQLRTNTAKKSLSKLNLARSNQRRVCPRRSIGSFYRTRPLRASVKARTTIFSTTYEKSWFGA